MPHFKYDEVRERPRSKCLTFPCLIVGGAIVGGEGGSEISQNLQKWGCSCMSNPHAVAADKEDPVVLFFHK